jgi:precorrin-6B methylase 1
MYSRSLVTTGKNRHRLHQADLVTGGKAQMENIHDVSERSVRDESTWVVTHLYMEAMLGISV